MSELQHTDAADRRSLIASLFHQFTISSRCECQMSAPYCPTCTVWESSTE